MIRGAFQHRSGRVIALGRVSIAVFYLLAAAMGRLPQDEATVINAILAGYVLAATALLVLTWSNWWLEQRLGTVAHVMDILVLGLLVTLSRDGYTSPIFVFFVFLVLSAAVRWGWREALVTAGVVALLFALTTWVALITPGGEPFEPQRFVIRMANLVVLSLMLAWFGVNYIGAPPARRADALLEVETGDPPIEKAMRYIAQRLRAARVVFAWTEAGDPWLNTATWEKGTFERETAGSRASSPAVAADLKGRLFLFDSGRGRVLSRERGRRRRTAVRIRDAVNPELVEKLGIDAGITIPVRAGNIEGELFVLDVPGLCPDDLGIAKQIEDEVRATFERASLLAATEDAVLSRARLSLARDLHDNVAQILAGISLKLRGIRKNAADPAFVDQQVAIMEQELVQQQQDIRMLIQMLRTPPQESEDIDFRKDLAALALRLERQWGVDIRLRSVPAPITLSQPLRHEVHQLVREAVANAVRHGEARVVTIAGSEDGEALRLEVADDGSGLGFDGEWDDDEMRESKVGPRSLQERIGSLGGTLKLFSSHQGTRLIITIPNEGV